MEVNNEKQNKRITQRTPHITRRISNCINVTRQTIISLENGKYNASLILAHDIAVYFGKTIEEIFLFEED